MKNTVNIKELISLYFDGKTTAEQESFLKEFFSQEAIPEIYKEDQLLLQALFQKDSIPIPTDLEQKLQASISHLALQEEKHKRIPFKTWGWMAAAATLIIALSLPLYFIQKSQQNESPQLSQVDHNKIQEAQKALILLSKNYNKGLEQLNLSQEILVESAYTLNKNLLILNP